jgi:predicted amidohydrolase
LAREGRRFTVASNGSEGCYGGWDLLYPLPTSPYIEVRATAAPSDLARGLDSIHAAIVWDREESAWPHWEPLLPVARKAGRITYEARAAVFSTARALRVRLLVAWSRSGRIRWSLPEVRPGEAPAPRRWRLGAAGGPLPPGEASVVHNTEAYLDLCREAAEANVDLLCLPEVMLTTGLPCDERTLPGQAIRLPGPEIEPFQEFARRNRLALCFSAWERNRKLVHNTAILISKTGELAGKYRKVHLASPYEVWWGVTPGHDFPVYQLGDARVTMNICMDSSALESARVPARLGAEVLCMPIMGDHRAVKKWETGAAEFDLDRWTAIQRVRAMDNQLYMVISRNEGIGSGIFSPRGEVLALSEGARLVHAPVDLADLPHTWTGATFRGVAWWERREPTYGPIVGEPRGR